MPAKHSLTRATIVAFCAGVLIAIWLPNAFAQGTRQGEADAWQKNLIKDNFASVRSVPGGVELIGGKNAWGVFRDHRPHVLTVGSTWTRPDRHFSLTYTVQRVEQDGVRIGYSYDGSRPALAGRWNGSFLLEWKSRGPSPNNPRSRDH